MADAVLEYLDGWYERASELDAVGEDLGAETLAQFRAHPSEIGRPIEEAIEILDHAGRDGIMHPSGGHLSYIPNSGMYTAALGEFLAAGLNRYTGVASAAPGLTAIEHGIIDWLRSIFDYPAESSGLLLSGGSMANFTGIVTARTAKLGDDFSNGVLYVTAHTHHSAAKAARLAGFRSDQVVKADVDADRRLDVSALRARIAADRSSGREPFLVVASAGTTDTGTIDPLDAVADLAAEEGLWMHTDAAYGGFFNLTNRGAEKLAGIGRADSIALDPHKGLSIPFGVGALIARSEQHLVDAHLGRGAYLRDEDSYNGVRDIASLGPELSRPFRALSVWLPLQVHGVAAFRSTLDAYLDLAEEAYERLRGMSGVNARWSPDLSIVAFGFDDDETGRAAWQAVLDDGRVHLSPTIIDDRFILRLAILNRRTTADHIHHALDIIEKSLVPG